MYYWHWLEKNPHTGLFSNNLNNFIETCLMWPVEFRGMKFYKVIIWQLVKHTRFSNMKQLTQGPVRTSLQSTRQEWVFTKFNKRSIFMNHSSKKVYPGFRNITEIFKLLKNINQQTRGRMLETFCDSDLHDMSFHHDGCAGTRNNFHQSIC